MSSPLGGYAAAAQISVPTLQDILTLAHHAGQLPSTFNTTLAVERTEHPGGSGTAKIELSDAFLDVPRINPASSAGGQLELSCRLSARMRITSPTCDSTVREVRLTLTAAATLDVDIGRDGEWVFYTTRRDREDGLRELIRRGLDPKQVRVEELPEPSRPPGWPTWVPKVRPPVMPVVYWEENVTLGVNVSDFAVSDSSITLLSGPPLPLAWDDWFTKPAGVPDPSRPELRPPQFGLKMQVLLKPWIKTTVKLPGAVALLADALGLRRRTPVLAQFDLLGGVVATPRPESGVGSATSIMGAGFVTFGIDVASLTQRGDPAAVADFRAGSEFALALDKVLERPIAASARESMQTKLGGKATLTELTVGFNDGYLRVAGRAEATGGGANFSLHATPMLGRPAWLESWDNEYGEHYSVMHAATDEIWIDISEMKLNVDPTWWATLGLAAGAILLGYLAGPIGVGAYAALVNYVVEYFEEEAVRATERPVKLLYRRFPVGLGRPGEFDIFVSALQVLPDRFQARMKLIDAVGPQPRITGPTSIDALSINTVLTYWLAPLPLDWHPADPEIRTRWTLRCTDTNKVLKTVDHPPRTDLATSGTFRFRLSDYGVGSAGMNNFSVSVRVYRRGGKRAHEGTLWETLGAIDFDVNETVKLHVNDRLSRSRPYVRWRHSVYTPNDWKGPPYGDGPFRLVDRRSRIHRTDVPGRCRCADRYTVTLPEPEYLDELPFPVTELARHRPAVCDYCFYGGPTNTELKPLP